jgi:hypothetical protein
VIGVGAAPAVAAGAVDAAGAAARMAAAADDEALAQRLTGDGVWGRDLRAALEAAGVDRDRAFRLAVRFGRRPA